MEKGAWIGKAKCCRVWNIMQPVAIYPLRKCGICNEIPEVIE